MLCLNRCEAFFSQIESIALRKKLLYFKFIKRAFDLIMKKRANMMGKFEILAKVMKRRNMIFDAFYCIKLSRGPISRIIFTSP